MDPACLSRPPTVFRFSQPPTQDQHVMRENATAKLGPLGRGVRRDLEAATAAAANETPSTLPARAEAKPQPGAARGRWASLTARALLSPRGRRRAAPPGARGAGKGSRPPGLPAPSATLLHSEAPRLRDRVQPKASPSQQLPSPQPPTKFKTVDRVCVCWGGRG